MYCFQIWKWTHVLKLLVGYACAFQQQQIIQCLVASSPSLARQAFYHVGTSGFIGLAKVQWKGGGKATWAPRTKSTGGLIDCNPIGHTQFNCNGWPCIWPRIPKKTQLNFLLLWFRGAFLYCDECPTKWRHRFGPNLLCEVMLLQAIQILFTRVQDDHTVRESYFEVSQGMKNQKSLDKFN